MIRQYYAQQRQSGVNPLGIGVIAVGSVYYLQTEDFFRDRFGGRPTYREPFIVEAFMNGTACALAKECPHRQMGGCLCLASLEHGDRPVAARRTPPASPGAGPDRP